MLLRVMQNRHKDKHLQRNIVIWIECSIIVLGPCQYILDIYEICCYFISTKNHFRASTFCTYVNFSFEILQYYKNDSMN